MTKCERCNGSGIATYHRADGLAICYPCPDCKATKTMTNYDRIMANMTVGQMAELFVRDETRQEYPDDIPYDSYTTEHTPGYYCFRDDAIQAEIEWLKSEVRS